MSTSQDVKCQHNFDRAECHECHEIAGKVVLITDMFLVGILSLYDPFVELKYAMDQEGGIEVNAPYTPLQDVLSALLDSNPDLCIDIGVYLLSEGTSRVRKSIVKDLADIGFEPTPAND